MCLHLWKPTEQTTDNLRFASLLMKINEKMVNGNCFASKIYVRLLTI